MRRLGLPCVLLFLVLAVPSSARNDDQAPPATTPPQLIVQGTITGPDGLPVPGARVDIRKGDATPEVLADTLSDVDGRFALLGLSLPPGHYLLHASAVGLGEDGKSFEIPAGPAPSELTFALKLALRMKGRAMSTGFTVVRVFYATDRQEATDRGTVKYLGVKSEKGTIAYGSCQVSIPETHSVAEIERPSIWRLEFRADPEKHIVLQKVVPETQASFYRDVSGAVASSPTREAFVFIHGYNVSFEDAAVRTAQLAYDFGYKGAPIFYSWPSRSRLLGYLDDEKSVAETVGHLTQFLRDVADRSGATVVHLIAHSMGNRALLPAVAQLAADPRFTNLRKFNTVVLAAPDVDRDAFTKLVAQIQKPANRITLYVSERDQALAASHLLFHKERRAGEGGPNVVMMAGIDTVDVSRISVDALGHSYYGDSRSVVLDLLAFFKGQLPPRPGLTRVPVGSLGYWRMLPLLEPGK